MTIDTQWRIRIEDKLDEIKDSCSVLPLLMERTEKQQKHLEDHCDEIKTLSKTMWKISIGVVVLIFGGVPAAKALAASLL